MAPSPQVEQLKHNMRIRGPGSWHPDSQCCLRSQISHRENNIKDEDFTFLHCDLASLQSVRECVESFRATGRTLDCLVCNAAVYYPKGTKPTFTVEGFEESVGVNHLAHFLLATMLMEDLKKSEHKRMIIVGSITGTARASSYPCNCTLAAACRAAHRHTEKSAFLSVPGCCRQHEHGRRARSANG